MTTDCNFSADLGDAPDMELEPGSELNNGQFKITKFLASGGFGMTYLAKDSLDRDVVVKECFPSALCYRKGALVVPSSPACKRQFQSVVRLFVREAKAMAKLVHPNIVGVHQIFEDNDTAYMALDYVDGCDLLDVIEENQLDVSPERLVAWLRSLLSAVEFVHEHDVLHRDISPDNILVDRYDNPILIDFGAAREQATRTSRAMTTLRVVKDGYSPQEFYVDGSAQTNSSDLYALGASFYHLIDGETPPNSQSRLAAIAEGRDDPYRPLAGRILGYPAGILEAIDMSLKVLPNERLQSARAWINLIDAAGPFAAPKPLDFDFDAIRDEVARIAEEFEDVGDFEAEATDPKEADPVEEISLDDAEDEDNVVPLPDVSRRSWYPRLIAASFAACLVVGGSYYVTGFLAPDRVAALAILTSADMPDASPSYSAEGSLNSAQAQPPLPAQISTIDNNKR